MTFHCAGRQLRHAAQAPSALSSCAERAGITQPISHRSARISREDRIKGPFRAGPIQTGPQITFKKGPIGQAQNPDHISHNRSGALRSETSYLWDQKECVWIPESYYIQDKITQTPTDILWTEPNSQWWFRKEVNMHGVQIFWFCNSKSFSKLY